MTSPKKIGFLSFGAWHPGGGLTHTGGDALRQTVELAVAAEELGIDGAFVRVHHFARQLSSPFPLLAAIGVKTSQIEIGTGVIDMRYENPLYMAENAAAADLLAGGRLQLGVSRGSPEPAWRGAEAFGYPVDHNDAREKTALFRAAIAGAGVVPPTSAAGRGKPCSRPAAVAWPRRPDLVGLRLTRDRRLGRRAGHEPDELDAPPRGHARCRSTNSRPSRSSCSTKRGRRPATPGTRASRSAAASLPITTDFDRRLFGADTNEDQVGWLDGAISRFGRSYTGEPDRIADELAQDAAVQAADTILLTVPSQLGVDYNAAMLETIARDIAPAIGWSPKDVPEPVG